MVVHMTIYVGRTTSASNITINSPWNVACDRSVCLKYVNSSSVDKITSDKWRCHQNSVMLFCSHMLRSVSTKVVNRETLSGTGDSYTETVIRVNDWWRSHTWRIELNYCDIFDIISNSVGYTSPILLINIMLIFVCEMFTLMCVIKDHVLVIKGNKTPTNNKLITWVSY